MREKYIRLFTFLCSGSVVVEHDLLKLLQSFALCWTKKGPTVCKFFIVMDLFLFHLRYLQVTIWI